MGSQPRGVGQASELTNQANSEELVRTVPEWARGTNGVLLEDIELTYAPKAFGHGLGRVPVGWFEVGSVLPHRAVEDVSKRTKNQLVLSMNAEQEYWHYMGSTPAGTTVINESPIWEAHYPTELLKAELVARSSISDNAVNYRRFNIYKRAAPSYSSPIQLASRDTSADAITAWNPWELTLTGTPAQLKFARGDSLTAESTVAASGATLSDAMIEFDLCAPGPRKVNIWVY